MYRQNTIYLHLVNDLTDAAGPSNCDLFDVLARPKSEVYPAIARGSVADGRADLAPLHVSVFGCDSNLGADAHPVTFFFYLSA